MSTEALTEFPDKRVIATASGWFLDTTDEWTEPYFHEYDPHHAERELFCR